MNQDLSFLRMKKFLLLSHYAPKPGFKYPGIDCPLAHRETAHKRIYDFERFWGESVLWRTIEVENTSIEDLEALINNEPWDAVWLSGSPYLLSETQTQPWIKNALKISESLLKAQIPVVGLCFGLQLLAKASGATVTETDTYKSGEIDIFDLEHNKLLRTRTYHENYVANLPSTAKTLGQTKCGMPYIVKFNKKVLGIQSHPECALESMPEKQKAEMFWQQLFLDLIK